MLRITKSNLDGIVTLKLEGKLLAPWIAEAEDAFRQAAEWTTHVRLDLSALSFVDAAGIRLIRELLARGCQIISSSNYVSELLSLENKP